MSNKQLGLLVVVAVIAGLIGRALSSQLLVGKCAFAHELADSARVITAEEFRLVDRHGCAVLIADSPESRLAKSFLQG